MCQLNIVFINMWNCFTVSVSTDVKLTCPMAQADPENQQKHSWKHFVIHLVNTLKTRMWQNERPASDLLGLLGVIEKSFLAPCRRDPGSLPSLHPHVAWDLHPGTECPRYHGVALLIDRFLFHVIPRWIPAHKILQDTAGVGCLWTQTRTLNEVM